MQHLSCLPSRCALSIVGRMDEEDAAFEAAAALLGELPDARGEPLGAIADLGEGFEAAEALVLRTERCLWFAAGRTPGVARADHSARGRSRIGFGRAPRKQIPTRNVMRGMLYFPRVMFMRPMVNREFSHFLGGSHSNNIVWGSSHTMYCRWMRCSV